MGKLIGTKDAAALLGVSQRDVQEKINGKGNRARKAAEWRKRLGAQFIAGRWLLDEDAVKREVERRKQDPRKQGDENA